MPLGNRGLRGSYLCILIVVSITVVKAQNVPLYEFRLPESYLREKGITEIYTTATFFQNNSLYATADTFYTAKFKQGKMLEKVLYHPEKGIIQRTVLTIGYDTANNVVKEQWSNAKQSEAHTYTDTYENGRIVYTERDDSLLSTLYLYTPDGQLFSKRYEAKIFEKEEYKGGFDVLFSERKPDYFNWQRSNKVCSEEYFSFEQSRLTKVSEQRCYLQEMPEPDTWDTWYYKYSRKGILLSAESPSEHLNIKFVYDRRGIISKETRLQYNQKIKYKMIIRYKVVAKENN